jgi:hypothetical protein
MNAAELIATPGSLVFAWPCRPRISQMQTLNLETRILSPHLSAPILFFGVPFSNLASLR